MGGQPSVAVFGMSGWQRRCVVDDDDVIAVTAIEVGTATEAIGAKAPELEVVAGTDIGGAALFSPVMEIT